MTRIIRSVAVLALLVAGQSAVAIEDLQIEAVSGEPFGIGKISWRVAANEKGDLDAGLDQWLVVERNGRVLYPAVNVAPVRQLLRTLLDRPERPAVYFLFRGNEPLSLTLYAPNAVARDVQPIANPRLHRRLQTEWWREFLQGARRNVRQDELPPVVENYLVAMLSRRLGLPTETLIDQLFNNNHVNETLGLFLGTESIRAAMQKETVLRTGNGVVVADQPLPPAVVPPPMAIPALPDNVEIEPIALHVPAECFYVRFGSFDNFSWTRATLDDWGGDLRNMLAVRGVDYGNTQRIERQLLMKESVLSKIFGPQVIADVAMIGQDTFLREGAAFGIIFEAKNNFLLSQSLKQQRTESLADKSVKDEVVEIAGRKVSFYSTPDNKVRSFYAIDGDFHLVTNSRAIVKRFFEAGQKQAALGALPEFKYARSLMPLSRGDTAWVYLSDEFFRNIIGPKYRVEMTRRLQALTDLELIQLARLAAKAERVPGETIEQLVQANLLPPSFGKRADGSRPIVAGADIRDSLRGTRGTFTPIPDIEFDKITAAEAQAYDGFARLYKQEWERVDPVTAAVRREPAEGANRERIVLDVHVAPFAKKHYTMLSDMFGPPSKQMLAPVPGDMISAQAIMGPSRQLNPGGEVHHLFAGLRDYNPPFEVRDGMVLPSGGALTDMVRGYLGAWPKPGVLSQLIGNGPVQLDANGMAKVLGGFYFKPFGDFSLLSWQPDVLAEVGPKLQMVEADRPAQFRLVVQDLTQSKLTDLVNTFAYLRAKKTSAGNVRFLHSLSSQFQLPREDCLAVAQQLVDAKLVCPLGGSYKLNQYDSGLRAWTSTGIVPQKGSERFKLPDGYQPPPMNWFRGLTLDLTILENEILAHAEILTQRKGPVAPAAKPAPPQGEEIPQPAPKPNTAPPPGPPVPSRT